MRSLILAAILIKSCFVIGQDDHCFCDFSKSTGKPYEFKDQAHYMEYLNFNDSLRKTFDEHEVMDSILYWINKDRICNNLTTLTLDTNLNIPAELQAKYCADNDTTTHDNPIEGNFSSRAYVYNLDYEVVTASSLRFAYFLEQSKAQLAVCNFLISKGHSQAIHDPENRKCGISVKRSMTDHNTFYTVIVFAKD